ncbi:MAG: hypothetical protein ACI8R9_000232 [Paraglaciecola sp.]|jgi:hypothetical protein
MDCSHMLNGRFERKAWGKNSPGVAADVQQAISLVAQNNHFAQRDNINKFNVCSRAASLYDFKTHHASRKKAR